MSKRRKILLNSIVCTLCILLFGVRVTGPLLHLAIGIMLVAVVGVHIRRHYRKVKCMEYKVKVLDFSLIAILGAMVLSGVLLHGNKGNMLFMLGHKLSSLAFCIGAIVHVLWHKKSRGGRISVS